MPESPTPLAHKGIPTCREREHGRVALSLNLIFMISLVLVGLAIVGVFIEIPFFSNYAFWVVIGAYVMLAGSK
jgi:hypothetical protein